MSGGGAGGTTQGPGNIYAQPQPGGGMGNAPAQPYNSGAPRQSTTPSNMGSAMGAMFGMLGQQPTQNPFGGQQQGPIQQDMSSMGQGGQQQQGPMSQREWSSNIQFLPGTDIDAAYRNYTNRFNPQPPAPNQTAQPTTTQSPLQAPQQPSPMGGMNAQPAVMPPGMQNQMPPGMQPAFGAGMPPGLQPGMQPPTQSNSMASLADLLRGQGQQGTGQPAFPPFSQTAQPMPPDMQTQGPQMPFGIQQGDGGSGFPPMQTPFQMPDGGGQLGPSPYPMLSPYPRPGKFSQPLSGGIGSLASNMAQPQSKQQMKEQMRQIQRMGPMPRTRPGGQPQQMFSEPQQYMY